MPSLATVNT